VQCHSLQTGGTFADVYSANILHQCINCFKTVTNTGPCSYPLMTPIGRSFIHFSLMPAA